LQLELALQFGHHTFEANEDTDLAAYTIPEDYNSYGARLTAEHSTMTMDRRTGWPRGGFLATAYVEWEANDEKKQFGPANAEQSLPKSVVRAVGHLEWLVPAREWLAWEITGDGGITDEQDRVWIYDAQKPIGFIYVQANVGPRVMLGSSAAITPFVSGQWVRLNDQFQVASSDEFFFGGGVKLRIDFAEWLALQADYSYLTNENREPVSVSVDTYGQHRFFVGLVARFGGRSSR
jgi:hypothetical protein